MMHMNKARPLYRTQWGPGYNKAPSKVVSIPVQFVGSQRSRTESATKIQRVVRGFLVRKSVKKMVGMRVELEQIEKKVNDPETVEVLRREEKERVRVGETIMNLLLRLDSVRVLQYSALRDFRRSLIKRAIALQELVDQMVVSAGPTQEEEDGEGKCVGEEGLVEGKEEEGQVGCGVHEEGEKMEALRNKEKMEVEEKEGEDGEGKCVGEESLVEEKGEEGQVGGEEHEQGKKMEALRNEEKMEVEETEKENGEGKCEGEESVGTSLVEEGQVGAEEHEEGEKVEALGKEEKMEVEEEEEEEDEGGCVGEESVGTSLVEEDCGVKEEEGGIGCEEKEENWKGEKGDEDGGNRELLERMMEDNEKMMEMMAQLFYRNEMQTRLLSSLAHRVEQLERAFACDKLRRKNKKRNVDVKHKLTDPKNGCI